MRWCCGLGEFWYWSSVENGVENGTDNITQSITQDMR